MNQVNGTDMCVRKIKGNRTSHFVKVCLWYVFLLTTLDFALFILKYAIVKRIWCFIKTKSFQMTQGGYQVRIVLPINSKMAAAKKQWFFEISVLNWVFTSVIQSPRLTNDYKFGIGVNTYQ